MRLKSEIWVQAYLRICASAGVAAVLVRRGDADAGAIYVRVNRLDGTSDLYGPAPAGGYGLDSDRQWVRCLGDAPRADGEVEAYLASQRKFDSDLWVIEAEDRQGRHLLDDWLAKG